MEPASLQAARENARALATHAGLRAVMLGGSAATGLADEASDLDLYALGEGEAPLALRRALAAARGRPGTAEIAARAFGPTDAWRERSGLEVDLMHWDAAWLEGEVAARMERHEPRVGYTTAVVHTVAVAVPLHDPSGWLAGLQARARAPYPEGLARAVLALNLPLLRGARHSFLAQTEAAPGRGDAVSVNHRTAAWLASFFDALFALNRRLHPGEKRLGRHAAALPLAPEATRKAVEALLRAPPEERPARMERLARALEALAAEAFGGQPFTAPSESPETR